MARDPRYAYLSHHPLNGAQPFSLFVAQGWALQIACWSCKRATIVEAADLVARYGAGATVGGIYRRLSCQACGQSLPAVDTVMLRSV